MEFLTCWILKSKVFGQKSTVSNEIAIFCELTYLVYVLKKLGLILENKMPENWS